jgi:hypothetical protein
MNRTSSPERASKFAAALPLLLLLLLGVCCVLSIHSVQPPESVPANSDAQLFSAERAMGHLRNIAVKPHPAGTEESARVRQYIVDQLTSMGQQPKLDQSISVRETEERWPARPVIIAPVTNITARLTGTQTSKPLLLAAHYDSVPTGPGASDDGSGVVTLLETLRALKSGPPLKNDVVFLFTDGEELGLLGAKAFTERDPLAREAGLVLNFEARGSGGPVFMFETSSGNSWLIEQLEKFAPVPVSNSLMYALYKRLPNDTDMSVFRQAGLQGLNFAYVGGLNHYHTALDNPEQIDHRSLQHDGSYALSLARAFGNQELNDPTPHDAVYFNVAGLKPVHYSQRMAVPLALAGVVLLAFALFAGRRARLLTIAGTTLSVCLHVFVIAAAGGAVFASFYLLKRWLPIFRGAAWGDPYQAGNIEIAIVALAFCAVSAIYLLVRRRSGFELSAGAIIIWMFLAVGSALLLPGASYLFTWPVISGAIGLIISTLLASRERSERSRKAAGLIVNAAFALPAALLLAPIVYMLFILLSISVPWVQALLTAIGLALVSPLFSLQPSSKIRWAVPLLAFFFFAAFLISASAANRFDEGHRKVTNLMYLQDADHSRATWATLAARPDEWTGQFLKNAQNNVDVSAFTPWVTQRVIGAEAPVSGLQPPDIQVLDDRQDDRQRRVRVRITPQRGANGIVLIGTAGQEILQATVDGRALYREDEAGKDRQGGPLRVLYISPPAGGFEASFEMAAGQPLTLGIVDLYFNLPPALMEKASPRPAYMMPAPLMATSDTSLIRREWTLPAK